MKIEGLNDEWHLRYAIATIKRFQTCELSYFKIVRMRKELEYALKVVNKLERDFEEKENV